MELIFVTNNKNKLAEIKRILGNDFKILSLKDIGFEGDIAETSDTIAGNSLQKTKFIYDKYGKNCFGDDTGLVVEALNGEPGVYSARYAGENATYEDNVNKLLKEMKNIENRKAYFITVITLFLDGKMYQFEGRVDGIITTNKRGSENFGYDPVFLPDGFSQTYAEMSIDEKNKISHRSIAVQKMVDFLKNYKKD